MGWVGVWVCGCVGVWVCGCVGVWECGCVGVWVCGCVGGWVGVLVGGWVGECVSVWVGMGVCGWVCGWVRASEQACVCVMCNYVILYMHTPLTCVMCALTDYKLLQITYDSHIRTVQWMQLNFYYKSFNNQLPDYFNHIPYTHNYDIHQHYTLVIETIYNCHIFTMKYANLERGECCSNTTYDCIALSTTHSDKWRLL